jgi:hypothetical protein
MTLRAAFAGFVRRPTPLLMFGALAVLVAIRVPMGNWTWRDAIVAGGILAAEPFTEWLIHVHLLHWRPRTVGGRRLDPLVARKHRRHHADPRDIDLVFVPLPVVLLSPIVGVGLPLLLAPRVEVALSASITSYAMFLAYEWTHYLIHSSYRPRRWPYTAVRRAHWNHHFRNERYWFGVTMHLGDRVLRTYPAPEDVELSPTARALHSEVAAAPA